MAERTLTTLALFSQSNLSGSESDLGAGIDFPDTRWLEWDGNGNCNLRVRFLDCPTPPQVGASLQTIKAVVRRSPLSGSNVVNAEFSLRQSGSLAISFGSFDITDQGEQLFTFTFDASVLPDPSGVGCELVIDQNGGGTGPNKSGFDVNSAELIYEDGIGAGRLIRTRACDGSCCVQAPRFPLGAGTPEDPHQGSDCLHHITGIGKQFHGCQIIEDASQQPTPDLKAQLKLMEDQNILDIFLATCVNWPQNTIAGERLGDCCWQWVEV